MRFTAQFFFFVQLRHATPAKFALQDLPCRLKTQRTKEGLPHQAGQAQLVAPLSNFLPLTPLLRVDRIGKALREHQAIG